MAWLKNPFPGIPVNSEVMGTKLIEITSGEEGTVRIHSECVSASRMPPFLLGEMITCFIPKSIETTI
jgi:hypothetical protein